MKKIGKELRANRTSRELTLDNISRETGISTQNLSRWERGEVTPSIKNCITLAEYYGISIDELIGRD